jgi:putative ABC transport system ATP-binding protein
MPGLPLSVTGLRLAFGAEVIIDLPEFAVPPGTLTVLAGPSGSGKSTLLYLLSGLLAPAAGNIRWGETDLAELRESRRDRWRRDHAGFVFQDFHLIEELSPTENVVAPAWFSRFSAASLKSEAASRLTALGVPQARRHTSLLSRGEQQRVAIARALIGDPLVIFADEPTASLDAASGQTVIAILSDLARREGRTVIAATHDPALLSAADRVVRLDHGHAMTIEQRAA